MNTLRQIGEFVGISPGTSMRAVGDILPVLSSVERTSMRAMILRLQNLNLPPISLEAFADNTDHEVPFRVFLRVDPSGGVVLETDFVILQNGKQVTNEPHKGNGPGPRLDFTFSEPGSFILEVTRTGINNSGITVLKKTFQIFARAKTGGGGGGGTPIVPPFISVKSNGDGSFVVSGSGFKPNAPISIRVADPALNNLFFTDTSTPDGKLAGFPTGKICRVAGGQITFSAQDGRIDPSNHQAVVSNFVTTTCPH